jgi:acyl-CoA reductase-like NAD-dependent aldehyde dehydrogenase
LQRARLAGPPVQTPCPPTRNSGLCNALGTTPAPTVATQPQLTPQKPVSKYGIAPWTLKTEEDAKAAVQMVASNANAWQELSSQAKVEILQEMHLRAIKATRELGQAAAKVR